MIGHLVIPLIFVGIVWLAMVLLNETTDLFRDRFPHPALKYVAYLWLGGFMFLMTGLVVVSSLMQPTPKQLAATPFYQLFGLQLIMLIFLFGWWAMTGFPSLGSFLNIQRERVGQAVLTGFAVGVGGWVVTILTALLVAAILKATGLLPNAPKPPALIAWLAALPLWKKCLIVLSAMTVEEALFRGFFQKRVGLLVSTMLFALAHVGLGQPFLLIGISVVSLIIGAAFYRTKNLIPGVIAHGVFDAVQLMVLIPLVFQLGGLGPPA
jgi:membrane protease YdiL (CAAX protease family)